MFASSRGRGLIVAALAASFPPPQDAAPTAPSTFERVVQKAKSLATRDFEDPRDPALPESLGKLDYVHYREIRFRPERALSPGDPATTPFRIHLFHRGYLFPAPVKLNLVEAGGDREVRYDPTMFDFRESGVAAESLPADLGFAGFRVNFPLNREDVFDELIAFLGASYFRVLGAGQVYGLSARGLAIDTATERGEEFPLFREFWIDAPPPGARRLDLYALLDSPSYAGAYAFAIEPGAATRVEVQALLVPRKHVDKLGVAPLTSMFLMGENRQRYVPDYRPEVHDSDGLLANLGSGEWLWRPLDNPPSVHRVTRWPAGGLRGFGLMQRDRDFASYEDLESRFEKRPNLWVEPIAGFESGSIELVEIPTPTEFSDNVIAYFVPDGAASAPVDVTFRYALVAASEEPPRPGLARVAATRIDPDHAGGALFVLSFTGTEGKLGSDVKASRGEVKSIVLVPDERPGGMRLTFEWQGEGDAPVELRARLLRGNDAASETWIYTYQRP